MILRNIPGFEFLLPTDVWDRIEWGREDMTL
jgi:hypothetical protein